MDQNFKLRSHCIRPFPAFSHHPTSLSFPFFVLFLFLRLSAELAFNSHFLLLQPNRPSFRSFLHLLPAAAVVYSRFPSSFICAAFPHSPFSLLCSPASFIFIHQPVFLLPVAHLDRIPIQFSASFLQSSVCRRSRTLTPPSSSTPLLVYTRGPSGLMGIGMSSS